MYLPIQGRLALAGVASTLLLSTGCAALERANQERLDKAVTVNAGAPLWEYRRVAFDPATCDGALCDKVNPNEIQRSLRQALTDGCYQVVDQSEYQRYAEFVYGMTGMNFMDQGFGMAGLPGVRKTILDPAMRQAIVVELGLDGFIKTHLNVGEPSDTTQFRQVTLDVELSDALGRQSVWIGRLDGTIMEDKDAAQSVAYLTSELGGVIARKASACGEPQGAPPEPLEVKAGLLELPDRVYFELGKADIEARSFPLLDEIAAWFESHREVKLVEIEGHTDDVGDDTANLKLSQGRAQAVASYLMSKGVAAGRMTAIGYGEAKPIVANDSPLNRAKNRRVEFRVVK